MENLENKIINSCSFAALKPAIVDLPYPPTQIKMKNLQYANILTVDFCGNISELSAITQYINSEQRLLTEQCSYAKILLNIALAEMMHLQKLAEIIALLGKTIDYSINLPNGAQKMWTPNYLNLTNGLKNILISNIESEKSAIKQYHYHIQLIQDEHISSILQRIILDEKYHIMLLETMLNSYNN